MTTGGVFMGIFDDLNVISEVVSISFDNYDIETLVYDDSPNSENLFKLKIIKPKGIYQSEFAKEIWLNEVRQLNKLKSVTHANKYLELIQDSFIEENNYYLTYLTNFSQTNLSKVIEELKSSNSHRNLLNSEGWLHPSNVLKISNRLILWKNILRVIEGLRILHSQNIIHRNIQVDSILFDRDSEIDNDERFILSGFEKSLDFDRLSNISTTQENDNVIFSTSEDWYKLALLIITLFGLTENSYKNSELIYDEERFLENLLKAKANPTGELIIAEDVAKSLNYIIEKLTQLSAVFDKVNYVVAPSTKYHNFPQLKESVRALVKNENGEIMDVADFTDRDFHDFIKTDIEGEDIDLFKNKSHSYFIKGQQCYYEIKKINDGDFSDWKVATIKDIHTSFPSWLNQKQKIKVRSTVKFLTHHELLSGKYRFQLSDDNSWKSYFESFEKENEFTDEELSILQGLLITLAIDAAMKESEIYLVTIEKTSTEYKKRYRLDEHEPSYIIRYNPRRDPRNIKLSNILKINSPSIRLDRHLNSDELTNKWFIEPNDNIDKNAKKHELEVIKYLGKGELVVTSKSNIGSLLPSFATPETFFKFYPEDNIGREASIKRKVQIFTKLMEHTLLLQSLSHPGDSVAVTRRNFEVEDILKKFDKSKQSVFNLLIKTQPNFVVGGPPGVGKTYLISNYVNHLFQEENNTKIVLSAQAHATVKNLHEKILEHIINKPFFNDLIIVKHFKEDSNERINTFNMDEEDSSVLYKTSEPYLADFKESELFKSNTRNSDIKAKLTEFTNKSHWSFFNKILKSANLVFTTSNSGLMANLVRNDISFDVSIMEESAKASGLELIGPMMIANKRILIGDHKQLPAFNENAIKRIISDGKNIDSLFLISLLEDMGLSSGIKNTLNFRSLDSNYDESLTRNIYKYFSLFESLSETAKKLSLRNQNSFGETLNIQHRMHPEICDIVSNTVYEDKLKTNKDHIEHCKTTIPFYFEKSDLIDLNCDKAVLWIDISDKQSRTDLAALEKDYTNNTEIQIIKEVLSRLRCYDSSKKYSISILSPYQNQVNLINKTIGNELLPKNVNTTEKGKLACTIDSFQGNEADLIIVSLVRHNGNARIRSALGFLSDMRRMNVMLSRAVYKMVIIGSFGLFSRWQEINLQADTRSDLSPMDSEFLNNFVKFCRPDFEMMKDTSVDNQTKKYAKVEFISSEKFLEVDND